MDDYWLHNTLYSYISDQRHRYNQLMYFRQKAMLKPVQKHYMRVQIDTSHQQQMYPYIQ
jgi:hypothetical protein